MTKGYKTAVLLIEFDGDKAFALTGQSEVAVELNSRSPQARLVLLLLHFPKLRCAGLQVPPTTSAAAGCTLELSDMCLMLSVVQSCVQ